MSLDLTDKVLVLRNCPADKISTDRFVWSHDGYVADPSWDPSFLSEKGLYGWLWGEGSAHLSPYTNDPTALWYVLSVDKDNFHNYGNMIKFPSCEILFVGSKKNATDILRMYAPKCLVIGCTVLSKKVNFDISAVGDYGTAVTGDYSLSLSGDNGISICRKYSWAFSGECGIAVSGDYGVSVVDVDGVAQTGDQGILILFWWDRFFNKKCLIQKVDGKRVHANTFYCVKDEQLTIAEIENNNI